MFVTVRLLIQRPPSSWTLFVSEQRRVYDHLCLCWFNAMHRSLHGIAVFSVKCLQNNRKWPHRFCIKVESNSQKAFYWIVLYTNMAAVTSDANHQLTSLISNIREWNIMYLLTEWEGRTGKYLTLSKYAKLTSFPGFFSADAPPPPPIPPLPH